jgi:Bacterial CdiA-CT RNAse A domain
MRIEGLQGPEPPRPAPELPVQDLEVYERHGGHTLRRHVDTPPGDELRRIVNEGISAAGRFLDRATAQRCVETAIRHRSDEIRNWLRSPHNGAPFTFVEDMRRVVGHTLTWHEVAHGSVVPRPVTAVRLVLRRRPELPGGYTVVTAFPTRARRRAG